MAAKKKKATKKRATKKRATKRRSSSRRGFQVAVGDFAKLLFRQGRNTERMWVRVRRRLDGGAYEGQLDNVPVLIRGLPVGSRVRFRGSQVLAVHTP